MAGDVDVVVDVVVVAFVVVTVVEVARRPNGAGVLAAWADASGGRIALGGALVVALLVRGFAGS